MSRRLFTVGGSVEFSIAPTDCSTDPHAVSSSSSSVGVLAAWRAGARTYGSARHTDAGRGETFSADFDQRVTRLRHSGRTAGPIRPASARRCASARASRSPAICHLALGICLSANDVTTCGSRRISRFDLRADRAFRLGGRRLHAFVEVVNLFDNSNTAATRGTFGPAANRLGSSSD